MNKIFSYWNSPQHADSSFAMPTPLDSFLPSVHLDQLHQQEPALSFKGLQKCINPVVLSQHRIYYPATRIDDQHWCPNESIDKPSKSQSQSVLALLLFAHHLHKTSFKHPRQRSHDHIGPSRYQQRIHPNPPAFQFIFHLLNSIFFLALRDREPHDLCCIQLADVGDVEKKSASIVPETSVPFLKRQAAEHNKKPIVSFALDWSIAKLASLSALRCNFPVSFLNNTSFLISSQPLFSLCGHRTLFAAPHHAPALTIKALCEFGRSRHHVLTEGKNETIFSRLVKICCDGRARTASQTDPNKTLTRHRDRLDNPLQYTAMGDGVSRTFSQVQRLHAANKKDNNRIVALVTITRNHHAFLAFAMRRSVRSCHANNSFSGHFAAKKGESPCG